MIVAAMTPNPAWPAPTSIREAKPRQAKPSQAKPSQAKPSQAKPSQAKPSQATPHQATPRQAEGKTASWAFVCTWLLVTSEYHSGVYDTNPRIKPLMGFRFARLFVQSKYYVVVENDIP